MMSGRLTRQIALFAGGLAIVGMGTLTACGKSKEKAPESTTPTTTTSAPAPSPTEKAVSPGGPNSFTPTVKAPPAPTALPGNVITGGN
ncbi:hypothetical protein H7J51_20995 [Mycobacterium crocinum]|uniref:Uncharacterized protein n=3 Tax=Mycobacteriaceae TaxID=1762 RepID=A0ABX8VG88_9MYCO|nr:MULTISPECIES: hypothetical protein [Mycolicibacterium]APE17701.1 hypothetical protein BOH72_23005 [Mycobacterium sp. WY10]MCV7217755.1 hypothetical protein [Mycolicibacterium crocinum]QYL16817.1 hypothetical protein K0O64_28290 [Mycolicibacterium pallens]ULN41393.1 hypothetical protein MI149_28105 [Mycolicibacterium crocinum]